MKPLIILILAGLLIFASPAISQPCDPPEIVHVYSSGGNVIIDFQTTSPFSLLGFNFYRDDEILEYQPQTGDTDYNETLESYYLNAYGMTEGKIYLEYDLSLSSPDTSGTEHLLLQVWNHQSEEYATVKDYSNQDGSFGWTRDSLNIKSYSMGRIFKIRFVASGDNSSHINYCGIDNINVYRNCDFTEGTLQSHLVNYTCIELEYIENPTRDLVGINLYLLKDGKLIYMDSFYDSFLYISCVNESGEYCFLMTYVWASESDYCESNFTEPTCQQVIINKLEDITPSTISFFLNPVNEFINVKSLESIDNIDVFDFAGRLVVSLTPGSSSFNFDVSYLNPGFYLARITSRHQAITMKFKLN